MSEIEQWQYEQTIAQLQEANARYDQAVEQYDQRIVRYEAMLQNLHEAFAKVDAEAGQALALLDSTSECMNQLYAHLGEGADDTRLSVARAMRDTWLDVERSVRQCLESIRERVVRGA